MESAGKVGERSKCVDIHRVESRVSRARQVLFRVVPDEQGVAGRDVQTVQGGGKDAWIRFGGPGVGREDYGLEVLENAEPPEQFGKSVIEVGDNPRSGPLGAQLNEGLLGAGTQAPRLGRGEVLPEGREQCVEIRGALGGVRGAKGLADPFAPPGAFPFAARRGREAREDRRRGCLEDPAERLSDPPGGDRQAVAGSVAGVGLTDGFTGFDQGAGGVEQDCTDQGGRRPGAFTRKVSRRR